MTPKDNRLQPYVLEERYLNLFIYYLNELTGKDKAILEIRRALLSFFPPHWDKVSNLGYQLLN